MWRCGRSRAARASAPGGGGEKSEVFRSPALGTFGKLISLCCYVVHLSLIRILRWPQEKAQDIHDELNKLAASQSSDGTKDFEKLFATFDADGSGNLAMEELLAALGDLGCVLARRLKCGLEKASLWCS